MVQEYLPSYRELNKLRNIPISKKIDMEKILFDTEEENLNDLTGRMEVLHSLDEKYASDWTYYSTLSYASLLISFLTLLLTITIVVIMIAEYQQDLIGTDEYELTDFTHRDQQNLEGNNPDLTVSIDLSKSYHSISTRPPLYENDMERLRYDLERTISVSTDEQSLPPLLEMTENPMYVDMENRNMGTLV